MEDKFAYELSKAIEETALRTGRSYEDTIQEALNYCQKTEEQRQIQHRIDKLNSILVEIQDHVTENNEPREYDLLNELEHRLRDLVWYYERYINGEKGWESR